MNLNELYDRINQLNKTDLLTVLQHSLFELRHQIYGHGLTESEIGLIDGMIYDLFVYKLNDREFINKHYEMQYDEN